MSRTCKLKDPERAVLRDILSMFRIRSVRDHFMGISPSSDVAILSSPLQQMYSYTFETGATFNRSNGDGGDSNLLSSESMLIPAYSRDGLNFGYMVAETYGLISEEFATVTSGVTNARIVARENDGTFFGVIFQPLVDTLVRIKTEDRKSTTQNFVFPSGTLAPLIDSSLDDISVFESAVCVINYSVNFSPCVVCGALQDVRCGCRLGMLKTKSSLDLQAIKQNLTQLYFGRSGGNGVYKLFGSDGRTRTVPIDFKTQVTSRTGHSVAKRLVNLALTDLFKSMNIGIARSLEPPLVPGNPNTPEERDLNRADEIEHVLDFSIDSAYGNFRAITSSADANIETIDDPLWPWSTTFPWGTPATQNDESPMLKQQQGNDKVLIPPPIMLQPPEAFNSSKKRDLRNGASTSYPKPIAPRSSLTMGAVQNEATEFDDEKVRETEEQLRAWRAYKRKIRNRESAARSNKARKERLELERKNKQAPPG